MRPIALAALAAATFLLAGSNLLSAGGTAPAAPTNLQVMVVHDALKITVLWDDNSDDEEQFVLERSSTSPGGPWGVAALLPADSTVYHDGGLGDGVTYWYRVTATNAGGSSDYSNVASGIASALPAPPPGDADCSGSVNSIDAALVLQFDAGLVDMLTFSCLLVADVNQDDTVNALDATLILQFSAGLIPGFVGTTEDVSGIRGTVTIGPMCPVLRKGVPCPDLPFSTKLVIEDDMGVEIGSVVSGNDGTFQIELDAGSYVIIPASPNPGAPPAASELALEVRSDAYTEVLIQYDSGIR